jgi:uncharacterized protein YdaU (DUF1376 family)
MKFYPHHINDYSSATAHLSFEEDCCYRRLLDRYYDTELPLEPDTQLLSRKCRVSAGVIESVLSEFFTLIDGKWHNSRADEEIARWYDKSSKARQSAEVRWSKQKNNANVVRSNSERNANALRTHCEGNATQDPIPNTQEVNLNPLVDADAPTTVDKSASRLPNCPHQKLVELFHVEAPSLPQIAKLNEARKAALAKLWKQVLIDNKFKTEAEGLEYFEAYFNHVEGSDFLTGRAKNGREWNANFDWVIVPKNFVKIIENTYHK